MKTQGIKRTFGILVGILCLALYSAQAFGANRSWETYMSAAKDSFQKGNYAQTENLLNAALNETKKFKETDPRVIITYGNLALLNQNQKKFPQAETFYERVLSLKKRTLSKNNPRIAMDFNNLATVLSAQGKFAAAEEQLQKALAINKQAYGKEHSSVATNLSNLASIYYLEGNSAQAEKFYLEALAIQKKALGPNSVEVTLTRNNLAELYRSRGEAAKVEPPQNQTAAIAEPKPAESAPQPNLTEIAENAPDPKIQGEKDQFPAKSPVVAAQAEAPIRSEKMGANTIQDLFQGQMDYILFFQGLAFFLVLAVCCLFRGDANQRLPWRWFGLFAAAQGIAAWLSLIAMNFADPSHLKVLGVGLHLVSWIFLIEFGRSGMSRNQGRDSGLWLVALLLMVTALGGLKGWSGIEFISRYTLGLVGGLWAAVAIFTAGRDLSDKSSSRLASISLGLFGVSTALSPPHSMLFTGSIFNQDLLLRLTGVPMEFCQALLAFGMAAGIYGFLPWREKEEATQGTRYRSRYMFALLATLSVILGLGSILTLYMGDWAHNRHEKVKAEAYEYAIIVVNRLNAEFKRLDEAGKALGETSWLALTLRTNREEDLGRINNLLDRYKDSLDASVCYLMDTTGKTIASSNRQAPDSFVGHSYGFRPYFKQAISGSIGRYFAVGVTSKVPGYYVGSPVRVPRGTMTRGVVAIKVSMDKITKEMQSAVQKGDSMMCLADPRGIVFLATNPDMVFKGLWPVEGNPAELQEQYGKDKFPAIFTEKIVDGAKVELQGRNYLVSNAGTIHAGWSVYFFRPIERVGMYRLTGILVACILAMLALVSLGSNFYLKEHAFSSASRLRAIVDSAPEAVAVIDPETSQLFETNLFMAQLLGYTQKELVAVKLDNLLNQEAQETHDQLQKIIQEEKGVSFDWQFRHKNGKYTDLEILGVKLTQGGREQALVYGREIAAGLRSKTPLPGQPPGASEAMLRGKINEFNNILSSLILQAEMSLDEQPKGSSAYRNMQEMLVAAVRAKDLLREMAILPPKELPDRKTASLQDKHILLVDDEAQLCRLEEKLLHRLGYRVSAFTESPAALKAFRKNPGEFDLVITDSSMAKLSGLELAREVLRLRPDLPIILSTGFGDAEKISTAQQMGLECLEKPILTRDLDQTIRRLLENSLA